jgi:hypothetical protein
MGTEERGLTVSVGPRRGHFRHLASVAIGLQMEGEWLHDGVPVCRRLSWGVHYVLLTELGSPHYRPLGPWAVITRRETTT